MEAADERLHRSWWHKIGYTYKTVTEASEAASGNGNVRGATVAKSAGFCRITLSNKNQQSFLEEKILVLLTGFGKSWLD